MSARSTIRIPGIRGEVIGPDDHDYHDARAVWNGTIDRRPELIARCRGTADVAAAVRVREADGDDTYRRLAEVKAKYDPENVFHNNKNIQPGTPATRHRFG